MKIKRIVSLSACLGFLIVAFLLGNVPGATAADSAEKPDWFFHDIVDVTFVQQYAKLPTPENVMIIDSRPKKPKYDKGYIPTAVNIPDSQFDKMTAKLSENKDTLLIFYCGGPT